MVHLSEFVNITKKKHWFREEATILRRCLNNKRETVTTWGTRRSSTNTGSVNTAILIILRKDFDALYEQLPMTKIHDIIPLL